MPTNCCEPPSTGSTPSTEGSTHLAARVAQNAPPPSAARTRILVVDNRRAVRYGLTRLLNEQPELTVCAAVGNAEQALEYMTHQTVDPAVVDISLGQMDGLQLARPLQLNFSNLHVLILSMHDPIIYAKHETSGSSKEKVRVITQVNEMTYENTPERARTPNLRFRRPTLYPIELQAHASLVLVL